MYKYIPYESLVYYAHQEHKFVNQFRKDAKRKRRKVFNSRLVDDIDRHSSTETCEHGFGSAVHLRTVNLGNGRYFDPIKEVIVTPEIVRFSDKCAFDANGKRYLKSCIIAFTDTLDEEVDVYEHTGAQAS